MCGTAGLFIGCPLIEFCPKRPTGPGASEQWTADDQGFIYKNKLKDWDTKAGVRTKSRRTLKDEETASKLYFSPTFVPIARHEAITRRGDAFVKEVLIQHFYRYMDFTEKLETIVVNRVAMAIAQEYVAIDLPDEMVFDAYKLYCDEAYHALSSADLKRQVQMATGVRPRLLRMPYFLRRLCEVQAALPVKDLQSLAEIFFVIVSETLISGTLAHIPDDQRVVSAVREAVKDHAEDEGRHHFYFASLLQALWPKLTRKQQMAIGPMLPEFICAFLSPDFDSLRYELASYNLTPGTIEQVLVETYPPELVVKSVKHAAKATLRYFEQTGMLEDPGTRDAFCTKGLIE